MKTIRNKKIYSKTKKRNGKTKKIKLGSILTEKEKPMIYVIDELKSKEVNDKLNNRLLKLFETPFTKKNTQTIRDDFFSYINNYWLKDIEMTNGHDIKYLTKVDNFQVTQYKTYEKLAEIIENYITKNGSVVSSEMKNLWASALKFNPVESSKIYVTHIIEQIDELRKNRNNLWKMLALVNSNEITNPFAPFSWEIGPDKKNSQENINYLDPHKFAIFDLSVYYDKNYTEDQKKEYQKKYRQFFTQYISKLFSTVAPNDKNLNAKSVFDVGQLFFQLFTKTDPKLKEDPDFYNKISEKEAIEKFGFNWTEYCKELGYKTVPTFFVTSNINYFKYCTLLILDEWNSEKWRSYWIWIFTRYIARLTSDWHELFYWFYGSKEKGMVTSFRSNIKHPAILFMSLGFNPILNNEYIDYSNNGSILVFAKDVAENTRNIFINRIKRNTWLSEKTKKYSVIKLDKIEINVGTKKIEWTNEMLPLLNFSSTQFLDNVLKILKWRHDMFIENNKIVINSLARIDWTKYPAQFTSLPSYVVNAQYVPYKNAVFISNAYLQKPFIDLDEHGIQFNLANLGFTIAHELSHSLDDLGSKYDIYGNLNYLWSKSDINKYSKIQENIIKQYEVFAKNYGTNYDAELSVGEDIADISGLSIAEEYLRDFCIKNKYPPPVVSNYFRIFYIYFALQMKQKIGTKTVKYELITNPHPIDKLRTNISLSRSPFFRKMYDVKPEDHMYWNNENFGIF